MRGLSFGRAPSFCAALFYLGMMTLLAHLRSWAAPDEGPLMAAERTGFAQPQFFSGGPIGDVANPIDTHRFGP